MWNNTERWWILQSNSLYLLILRKVCRRESSSEIFAFPLAVRPRISTLSSQLSLQNCYELFQRIKQYNEFLQILSQKIARERETSNSCYLHVGSSFLKTPSLKLFYISKKSRLQIIRKSLWDTRERRSNDHLCFDLISFDGCGTLRKRKRKKETKGERAIEKA